MGSIQLGSDVTGETSMSVRSMEGSARCSTSVSLLWSSWEAVASFVKVSARAGYVSDLNQREFLQ